MLYTLFLPLVFASVLAFLFSTLRRKRSQPPQSIPVWPQYPCRLLDGTGILARPEIPRSHYAVRNAQLMALTHNTMCRGLNALYAQAISVTPGTDDARNALLYASVIYDFIHDHHTFEEKIYFPGIEAATGQKGFMEENIEQHKKLEVGLGKLKSYALHTTPEKYDGTQLRLVIKDLADCLVEHLHDEIPTILNLWDKLSSEKLRKIYKAMHDEAERSSDLFKAGPFVLGCQDKTFLMDGQFIDFPELPTHAVHYLVDWIISKKYAGAWKFNPSTMYAEPRATKVFSGTEDLKHEKATGFS